MNSNSTSPRRAGGGGGGSVDDFARRLEALQDQLRTEREIVDEWYEEGQDLLAERRALEILGEEEHREALLALEEEYQRRLANVRDTSNGGALDSAATFFGEMAGVFQSGGEKMLKISRVFGAAEAFISTLRGAAKALELPFPANLAAYAKVLATGMGLVTAIKGVSAGGGTAPSGAGGGVSAAPNTPQAQASSNYVNVTLTGDGNVPMAQIRDMFKLINEHIQDGGNLAGIRLT